MENKSYLTKLTLGDWSKDGHSKMEIHYYYSNYNVHQIRQAYKDSCKLTGLQFNHNEDFTGGLLKDVYDSPRKMLVEYQNNSIRKEAAEILELFGIDIKDYSYDWGKYFYFINRELAADLIMKFISLSMPKDWEYKELIVEGEPINGWWNNELNVQFGYGLFS